MGLLNYVGFKNFQYAKTDKPKETIHIQELNATRTAYEDIAPNTNIVLSNVGVSIPVANDALTLFTVPTGKQFFITGLFITLDLTTNGSVAGQSFGFRAFPSNLTTDSPYMTSALIIASIVMPTFTNKYVVFEKNFSKPLGAFNSGAVIFLDRGAIGTGTGYYSYALYGYLKEVGKQPI